MERVNSSVFSFHLVNSFYKSQVFKEFVPQVSGIETKIGILLLRPNWWEVKGEQDEWYDHTLRCGHTIQ